MVNMFTLYNYYGQGAGIGEIKSNVVYYPMKKKKERNH